MCSCKPCQTPSRGQPGRRILASSSAAPHVKSGRVRALAVTMAKRSKFNPEWPTLQEAGVKEVDASNWTALYAPKGKPQAIIDKPNAEDVKNLQVERCTLKLPFSIF